MSNTSFDKRFLWQITAKLQDSNGGHVILRVWYSNKLTGTRIRPTRKTEFNVVLQSIRNVKEKLDIVYVEDAEYMGTVYLPFNEE